MQWNTNKNAGFSTADKTWLPVNTDISERNVAIQQKDEHSLLNVFKHLLQIRKINPALQSGSLEIIPTGNKQILAYTRTLGGEKLLVLLNFSNSKITNHISTPIKEVLFSINSNPTFKGILEGLNGVVLKL
jgi:glycosidase